MRISQLRLVRVRCFEDTSNIHVAKNCNIFVGKNNAGKSTLLRAILRLQGFSFGERDIRPSEELNPPPFIGIVLENIRWKAFMSSLGRDVDPLGLIIPLSDKLPGDITMPVVAISPNQGVFNTSRPYHAIVPFVANRKATQFMQDVSLRVQSNVTGTLEALYSRIDLVATYGHPDHNKFRDAVEHIIGVPITMKASQNGKEAGFYFDRENFVTLERMGDGVSEMVALIVELCTEQNKIFVLEEPETNLHPSGLKALLALVRQASENNQFFIATHSNVVVRELGAEEGTKVFRVFREGDDYRSPSKVEEIEKTPAAHMQLLRELGYQFADFDLFEGWLFLEESSAESVFRDILIPMFAPELRGRLRTYSSAGATNLEPSVSEFKRLIVFVHLQPVYEDRLWVRADGDEVGSKAVSIIRAAFPSLNEEALSTFSKPNFELYFPVKFDDAVKSALAETDKQSRRNQKNALLKEVLAWSKQEPTEARSAWEASAREPIALLKLIQAKLTDS